MGDGIVELGMEALARAADDAEGLRALLSPLPRAYAVWARTQAEGLSGLAEARQHRAQTCLDDIETARARIESGITRLAGDAATREAFAIANRAVAAAARQRVGVEKGIAPGELDPPRWRLFQLAFMLLNLDGLAERTHPDRATVDLLFFPTGGGKTEAYLGLSAIAIAHRRLQHPGLGGAGLSVLMRYTLRLLTLDQLTRAAGVICALELERTARLEQDDKSLGTWPIEIGLWVGGGVTPNRLGGRRDKKDGTLVKWLIDMKKGGPPPIPMPACPWCGSALLGHPSVGPADVFAPRPTKDDPRQLDILCHNIDCAFHGRRLPVVTVDEDIYRRLPAFMIATVDKFAVLPWEGRAGAFFGHVVREDADRSTGAGFYGPAEPNQGTATDAPFAPPLASGWKGAKATALEDLDADVEALDQSEKPADEEHHEPHGDLDQDSPAAAEPQIEAKEKFVGVSHAQESSVGQFYHNEEQITDRSTGAGSTKNGYFGSHLRQTSDRLDQTGISETNSSAQIMPEIDDYKSKAGGKHFGTTSDEPSASDGGLGTERIGSDTPKGRPSKPKTSRMLAYVARTGDRSDDGRAEQSDEENKEIDARAIERAMRYEADQGRSPDEQDHFNPGFDIISTEPNGRRRLIEVKGLRGPWNERGTKLSRTQFSVAQTNADEYWLYIVEAALDPSARQLYAMRNARKLVMP